MSLKDGPSENLKWSELACKDGTPYPVEWKNNRGRDLALVFEHIRLMFLGKPITVLSAYRSPEHNRAIGGARHSQHVQGRALDLKPPKGIGIDVFYDKICQVRKVLGITGLGKYTTFVHVDIRPITNTRIYATWNGTGKKDA